MIQGIPKMQTGNGSARALNEAAAITGKHNRGPVHLFFNAARQNADHTTVPVRIIKTDACRIGNVKLCQNFRGVGFHLIFYGPTGHIQSI